VSIYFTADTHLGHKNILQHASRPFGSLREMDEELIRRWNAVVTAKDTVYHLGDVGLCSPGRLVELLGKLKGTIHLVTGNHDKTALHNKCRGRFESISPLRDLYVSDHTAPKGKRLIVLCHYAMRVWNKRHWGSWHLYGHSHGKLPDLPDSLSFDVGVDAWDFRPVSYDQVRSRMGSKTWTPPFKPRK
jgi:calcineurin-like phosphoesterase family protein